MKTSKKSNSDGSTPIKINQQEQLWSEQRPGYKPLNPSNVKLTRYPGNRRIGVDMRGARKSLRGMGKM